MPSSTACSSRRWRRASKSLIGVVNDASFGPAVALGLGGVLAEVLKDVTHRIAPFDIETARDMIAELRGAPLFDGYRGKPAADKEALAQTLVAVSQMAAALAPAPARDGHQSRVRRPTRPGRHRRRCADRLEVAVTAEFRDQPI